MDEYLKKTQDFFKNDIFATEQAGIVILEAKPGYSKCSMKVDRRHLNAVGAVMGGAIFTLADFCFAVAVNGDISNGTIVSVDSTIKYVGKTKTDTLIAEACEVKSGRTLVFYDIKISDSDGNQVAVTHITGCRTK